MLWLDLMQHVVYSTVYIVKSKYHKFRFRDFRLCAYHTLLLYYEQGAVIFGRGNSSEAERKKQFEFSRKCLQGPACQGAATSSLCLWPGARKQLHLLQGLCACRVEGPLLNKQSQDKDKPGGLNQHPKQRQRRPHVS
jgi:hypothetical protein